MPVERLTEEGKPPPWIRHEHEARYQWAASLVSGKRVLDVACGTGYGAPLLLEGGATAVDGFDLDEAAVDEARRLHAYAGATFDVADGTNIPVPDAAYDVYLSFETIEHIEDDVAYVAEAARVLKPGGMFLCSTPNRNVTNPGTTINDKPFNPHHVREYTRDELEGVLERHFDVSFIGQTPRLGWYVRALGLIGGRSPMVAVRAHQARKLLGLPLEGVDRHRPAPWPRTGESEVIIARCVLR